MVLHAVGELVLGMRHVVERVLVLQPAQMVAVILMLRPRHFHLELGPGDWPVKLHVRTSYGVCTLAVDACLQGATLAVERVLR